MGRGSAPLPPQTPPKATPAPRPEPGQRQQPNVEQYLGRDLWWKDEGIKKEMRLTDMQVRTITQIFDRRVREVTPFYDEYLRQLAVLEKMSEERAVDETTYAVQVSRVEGLRSKLNETRVVMLYTIYRRLEPAQYQKLMEIRDRRRSGRGVAPPPRTW